MEQRQGYKKTKLGRLPEEWGIKPLEQLCEICYGKDKKGVEEENGKYDILGTGGVIGKSNIFIYDKPSVLIGRKGTIDKPKFIDKPFWTVDTLFYTKIFQNVNPKWLFFYIDNINLYKYNEATGVPSLSKPNLNKINIKLPPLPEQRKIASILSTVDEKIDSLDQQLGAAEQLKKGLMRRLLTKGIGHTEFKDTKIGKIPNEWKVVLLDSVTKRGSGHTPNRKILDYWNGGIKWVSLADTKRLDRLFINATEHEISEEGIKNSSAIRHKKGTVIISRDAGVGKSSILNDEMAVSQHFMAWECLNKLNNIFLYYFLQSWKPKFETIANGTTIKTIGLGYFKNLKVPLPPLQEQRKIAEILSTMDQKLDCLREKKENYQMLKKGLMQKLLTGQIRVNTTNTEIIP